jgi:FAD/FMN-containing dehydrogenase
MGTRLSERVDDLRGSVKGQVIEPADGDYESARAVWNGMIDRRPALVVRCRDSADVVAAVRFGREQSLVTAIRGGGHNVAGFGTCDDGLVIDLSPMNEVAVDAGERVARAGGGALWSHFDGATIPHGLATTGGLISHTGVGGLTLGGGVGWLMRKHGLTCDNLIGAELVTAGGEILHVSEEEDPELLWGLRGGGGNFGVVTSFEFRVHRQEETVYGGPLFYPLEQAPELLRFYREWTRTLPDELTTLVVFMTAPPEPFVPEDVRGTLLAAVAVCHAGDLEQGEAHVGALRETMPPAMDLAGPMPYLALQSMFDHSVPHGIHSYWRNGYLQELGDGCIEALCGQAAEMASLSPICQIHLHHLEGAVARVPEGATACGHRDARFLANVIGVWPRELPAEPQIAWVKRTSEILEPFVGGGAYVNFLADEGSDRVRAAYGPAKWERLVALKDQYDPDNFFRLNQNVRPSA